MTTTKKSSQEPECRFDWCECHVHGGCCNVNGGCDCHTLRTTGRLNDGGLFRREGTLVR